MRENSASDTIAAIATAPGRGGIGIIRLSGGSALPILQVMFSSRQRKLGETQVGQTPPAPPAREFSPRRLEHGWILNAGGEPLDEVLAVFMPGPHTFSGEDVAEIHCHGGPAVLEAVLETALARGARLAMAGEFTRRAFINGRLDLSQAEAVAEMIAAPTLQGVYLARNKLEGRLGRSLARLREDLDWLRARLYLSIDFPDDAEDDDNSPADAEFMARLDGLLVSLHRLILSHERARVWRDGALAALAGRVNVGKSSLLNALLGRKRALVSDIPGTTRDFIEEAVNFEGLPVRLVDTAGLRQAAESLEAEGIELARDVFEQADAIVLVLEAGRDFDGFLSLELLDPEERRLLDLYGASSGRNKVFIVLNKLDLHPDLEVPASLFGSPCRAVSAREGLGLDELARALKNFLAPAGELDFSSEAAPNLRQSAKLGEVLGELKALKDGYAGRVPADLLSVRLDLAADYLGDVIGSSGAEEVLDQVFSSFCIGK